MHISRAGDQSYVTQPSSSPLTRQDLSLLFISPPSPSLARPLSTKHVVCVQNKSVNNKYPASCACDFAPEHVARVENKNVNLECPRHRLVCVCVCVWTVCSRVSCVCVLAAIWEAVKSHSGALEVFYHAAVIVACLLAGTLSTGSPLRGCSAPAPSVCLPLHSVALCLQFRPQSISVLCLWCTFSDNRIFLWDFLIGRPRLTITPTLSSIPKDEHVSHGLLICFVRAIRGNKRDCRGTKERSRVRLS